MLLVAPHAKTGKKAPVRDIRGVSPLFCQSDSTHSLAAVTRTRFAFTPLSQPLEDKGNKPAWPQDLGAHFYQAAPAAEA